MHNETEADDDTVSAAITTAADAAAAAFNINSTDNQTTNAPFPSPSHDFDFDVNDWRHNVKKVLIGASASGSISFICSCAIMYHILRSHQGLSNTYHRLVFGLCVADVLSSFALVLGSTMVPKELNYYIPWANGNVATCSFQGFLFYLGNNCTVLYNCSICFYYLAIVRYNKTDVYIKAKLEPWFHAVAVVVPLIIGIIVLFLKAYNTGGAVCGLYIYDPPHCSGYGGGETPKGFTIPCRRGDWTSELQGYSDADKAILSACAFGFPILLTPFVIIITMVMMYRSLLKIEKKLQSYGAGALRLKALRSSKKNKSNDVAAENNILPNLSNGDRGEMKERCCRLMSTNLKCLIIYPCLGGEKKPTSKSNRAKSQKRSIIYMSSGYALAWAFTWIPFFIYYLLRNTAAGILLAMFTPLQGLFNLIVYMAPKVRNAKNTRRQKVSWCQAILKAWKSRGEQRREISGTRGTNGCLHKTIKQWMQSMKNSRSTNQRSSITTVEP